MAGVRWKNGANGHRIIHVLGHGNVRLDYMVATCFCPPCPIDGFIYTLCHKDSDPNNCCSGNLEWRRVQPVRDKMTDLLKVKIRPVGNIWLFEDGIGKATLLGKATKIGDNFRKNYILVKKFVMCN